jgi:hypothetical protein
MIGLRRVAVGLSVVGLAAFGTVGLIASDAVAAPPVSLAYTGATQTYSVPSDGSVCALTVDLAGANGGTATSGTGGTGGSVSATVTVPVGATVSIDVGGAGVSTAGINDHTGAAGGFGGGATGGDAAGAAGAGGGGATTVQVNGTVVLVAGGGGGGGGAVGGGGAGGSSGGAGTDASAVPGSNPGSGGTPTAGGAGGASPGAGASVGTDGTAGTGGAGGATTNGSAGGGGGGGGGYFGGGGGSGATTPNSGGGAGGGSGFADSATTSGVTTGTTTQDGSGNGAAQITPLTGTCPPQLTIRKSVTGDVPAGTTFTIHVTCSHIVLTSVSAQASQTTVDRDLVFDAAGNPTGGTNPVVTAATTDACHVSETVNGGATTVSYGCSDNSTGTAYCQAGGQDVQFVSSGGQTATVTVANTFPTAAAPTPVTVSPRFTG